MECNVDNSLEKNAQFSILIWRNGQPIREANHFIHVTRTVYSL